VPTALAAADRAIGELYTGRLAAHLDLLRSLVWGSDLRIVPHGLGRIDAALARQRGVILWISDLVSAADVSKIALAGAGYRIKHLSRIEHGFSKSVFGIKCLNPIRLKFENQLLDERVVFDRMNPAPAMTRLLDCLHGNGIVSIVASAHEGGTLADVPFFAGRLRLALGAFAVRAPYRPCFGAHAQIFTRAGARKIASAFAAPWMPNDMTAFADGLVKNLRILEIDPPLAFHPPPDVNRSTIDPDGIRPRDAQRRRAASPLRRWRRSAYECAASLRVFRNFVSQWGLLALLRLER
jgi:hypothetical protein